MTRLGAAAAWLEYLQGAREEPPAGARAPAPWLLTALWWVVLIALIAAFSGQTSNFIYIDF